MSHYVDGFVVPVPRSNLDAYVAMARRAGAIWKEHGALQYWECVGDDVKPGKVTSFPQSVKLKPPRPSSSPGSPTSRGRTATASTPRSWPTRGSPA